MMEVSSAGSATMAARTLEGSAAWKEAEAWALLAVRFGGRGDHRMITHGLTDWAAAMPQTARATAEMSFILRFGGD